MKTSLLYRPGQSPIPTLGGKGMNLLNLAKLGQPVPPWFAVPAKVFPASPDPARVAWVVETCVARGWRYCHRVHIELFGNRRGV